MAAKKVKIKKSNNGELLNYVAEESKRPVEDALPPFNIGDTVRIYYTIVDERRQVVLKGERKKAIRRVQPYEGTVISMKNSGIHKTFTVRKISFNNVGVERTFPYNSPNIQKIEVVRQGKVRRAKLYYLRDRIGKAAQVKARNLR